MCRVLCAVKVDLAPMNAAVYSDNSFVIVRIGRLDLSVNSIIIVRLSRMDTSSIKSLVKNLYGT
ncbi:4706_t:CDS:2 [Dentiscutata erythropus]|uniref:4706_t:CDS:1 n=1 Tax=Dentiscutata erythropus TaxID=1348616 RepID=A0A9N8VV57_9GLOM|nr:4706_t:CDS:2 [Dentiscutata erythropus]